MTAKSIDFKSLIDLLKDTRNPFVSNDQNRNTGDHEDEKMDNEEDGKDAFSQQQQEMIMIDYLQNLRVDSMTQILCMPPLKCVFDEDYCLNGSSSLLFWKVSKFLNLKDMTRKIKFLSHLHRQMYFQYRLIEDEQQSIDGKKAGVFDQETYT